MIDEFEIGDRIVCVVTDKWCAHSSAQVASQFDFAPIYPAQDTAYTVRALGPARGSDGKPLICVEEIFNDHLITEKCGHEPGFTQSGFRLLPDGYLEDDHADAPEKEAV